MNTDTDSLSWRELPCFLSDTEVILSALKAMDYDSLKRLWKCNDNIAMQNHNRLRDMNLNRNLTPAVLAYEGIQYQYMAPNVFTDNEFQYIQEHLRILSGFYGLLRPFDGVTPYRLEMQAKLKTYAADDLYAFWGDKIARQLFQETDFILNLASREYSICVSKYLTPNVRFITCVFGEEKDGKVIEKGTMCKMARGEMVRLLAENNITEPEHIKTISPINYTFAPGRSDDKTFVFLRSKTHSEDYR